MGRCAGRYSASREQRPLHSHVDKARAREVGPLDARALQTHVLHRDRTQVGADPRAVGHLVVRHLRVAQVGAVEDRPRALLHGEDLGAAHERAAKVDVGEDGSREVGLGELGARKVGRLQVRALQVGACQQRAAQARAGQVGAWG